MLTELRVRDLATIADVTLHPRPRPQRAHRRDRRRQVHAGGRPRPAPGRAGRRAAACGPARPRRSSRGRSRASTSATRRGSRRWASTSRTAAWSSGARSRPKGRSRAWVNGSPTTAAVLGQLGALLVDLHGQHETQSLLHADAQRDILDAFAHAEAERAAVAEAHAVAGGAAGRGDRAGDPAGRGAPPGRLPAPRRGRDRPARSSSRARTRRCRSRPGG